MYKVVLMFVVGCILAGLLASLNSFSFERQDFVMYFDNNQYLDSFQQVVNISTTINITSIVDSRSTDNVPFIDMDLACDDAIPSYYHIMFYNNKEVDFGTFISWCSGILFYQPSTIYIWMPEVKNKPRGYWWKEFLLRAKGINIIEKSRQLPTEVNGRTLREVDRLDILSLEVIEVYGGLTFSKDLIACRPLTYLRCSDVTLACKPGVQNLSHDFIMARPHSKFIRSWYDIYKHEYDIKLPHIVRDVVPNKVIKEYNGSVDVLNTITVTDVIDKHLINSNDSYFDFSGKRSLTLKLNYQLYNIVPTPQSIKDSRTTMGRLFRLVYYGSADVIGA